MGRIFDDPWQPRQPNSYSRTRHQVSLLPVIRTAQGHAQHAESVSRVPGAETEDLVVKTARDRLKILALLTTEVLSPLTLPASRFTLTN